MKKVLMLLVLVVLLTGCTINELDINDFDNITNNIIKTNNKLVNTVSVGYKYYIPKGVNIISRSSYNEKLYYNRDYYYLYVDVVSYYNKKDQSYELDNNVYYFKELNNNGKKGYIQIKKNNDKYFIQAYYNYAKIEAYVSKNNLKRSIINIEYIIMSVRFNNPVTKLVVGNEELRFGEEKPTFFKIKKSNKSFLDYVEEYDRYDKEILIDEENVPNELGNDEINGYNEIEN